MENTTIEIPTFTCCHCNRVVVMNPDRRRDRHVCRRCMAITCDSVPCVLECDPTDRKIEQRRPLLLPEQVPADKIEEFYPKENRHKTPLIWLPERLR